MIILNWNIIEGLVMDTYKYTIYINILITKKLDVEHVEYRWKYKYKIYIETE